ncbi:PAS domain-containing sensor histidine kinase [Pseudomonas sp. RTC3]|uniref:sensor histidine kinase n=1 Tax=Pseudomonas sp. 5C2 TaxID=3048588 RepID=UPI002AB38149|nr:PAS domain-containing sensor histidine kinase [Pseudomonas sp. 5C2]MDY7566661.1 PAS domain-containing sensor histidine kinase [Pseudomonas sp. 5C2]MEB0061564.1 PAS domain-containing sensor histidine kinase [Pseudomonas sp. RTC3]MEB0240634.1 PAS domain-containing sensor histidine kinase [Pseudomonas sp. 5C2]
MQADNESLPDSEMLFDDADRGLLLTAEDGQIKRVNLTFCHWIGYSREELLGRQIQSLMRLTGRSFYQNWVSLMQIQGEVADVKFDLVHHNGCATPMIFSVIRCEHSTGIFHELSLFRAEERHRYERDLLNARMVAERHLAKHLKAQRAQNAAQDKLRITYAAAEDRALFAEQMIGIVSHDLRNPLSAIIMATDMLGRGELDAKQRQVLGHITHSAQRAQRLVADLLDFTLTQVGRGIAVSPKPVDLHELVAGCLDELRRTFPGHELSHLRVGHCEFTADSDRLYQLIGNLVANAISYGSADGGVTVSSLCEDHAVSIVVHNVGTPIRPALLDNLFEPMIRGSHDNAELHSLGLGLFIVREIARAHHGDVTVTSSIGSGTTLTATFPRSAN